MSGAPKISIIIPVFNRENLILECLASAQKQTEPDIEIIVCDNQSTDATVERVSAAAQGDSRIRLIRNPVNVGPARNWLVGLEAARGRYVRLLFSDDTLHEDACSDMIAACESTQSRVAFSAANIGITPWLGETFYNIPEQTKKLSRDQLLAIYLLTNRAPFSPCAFVFDRALYLGIFRDLIRTASPDFLESGAGIDLLSIIHSIDTAGGAVAIPKQLVFFRSHPGSITISRWGFVSDCYQKARASFVRNRLKGLESIVWRCLFAFRSKLRKHVEKWAF